jgi:hypothetical protein
VHVTADPKQKNRRLKSTIREPDKIGVAEILHHPPDSLAKLSPRRRIKAKSTALSDVWDFGKDEVVDA